MSIVKVKEYLKQWNRENDVTELTVSTATVELAAEALGVAAGRIAKSISLKNKDKALMVVAAGDTKIDNKKFKAEFGFNPKMLNPEDALIFTGFAVGGICPFGLPSGFAVYLDESLKECQTIFPACGSANSMIELTVAELEEYSKCMGWVDVCKKKE